MSTQKEDRIRLAILILLEVFTIYSVIRFSLQGDMERILLSAVTVLLLFLPSFAERLLHCRFSQGFYILCMWFATSSMLGHSWRFYYMLPGWDKLMHLFAGFAFAMLGVFLPRLILKREPDNVLMTALFALCFSMAVSVAWEFVEYSADTFFQMDMQSDAIVHTIRSYKLGDDPGVQGVIENIEEVVINGEPLGVGGYIDLGRLDTMNDMLFESAGALIYSLIFYLRGGKQRVITYAPDHGFRKKKKKAK